MNEPSEDHRKFFPTLPPPPPPPPDMFTVPPPRENSDSNGSVVVVLVVIVVAVVLLFCWVLYKLCLHEKKKREDSKKNNVCKVEAVHNELKKSRSGKIADVPVYGPDRRAGKYSGRFLEARYSKEISYAYEGDVESGLDNVDSSPGEEFFKNKPKKLVNAAKDDAKSNAKEGEQDMSTGSKSESAHKGQPKEVESVEDDANINAPDRNLKAGGFEEGPSRSKDEMTRNTRANKKGKN